MSGLISYSSEDLVQLIQEIEERMCSIKRLAPNHS
jgi:hypothetical protein